MTFETKNTKIDQNTAYNTFFIHPVYIRKSSETQKKIIAKKTICYIFNGQHWYININVNINNNIKYIAYSLIVTICINLRYTYYMHFNVKHIIHVHLLI